MDAVINFKTDNQVKARAQKIAAGLGLSLSGILNVYLRDFVRSKSSYVSLQPSAKLLGVIKQAEDDLRQGNTSPTFSDVGKAIGWLDNKNRKYEG